MTAPSDTSVASILITLAGRGFTTTSSERGSTSDKNSSIFADQDGSFEEAANSSVKDYLSEIYSNPMSLSIDDFSEDIDDSDRTLLCKDRSTCTVQELEMIRRERNRIHAKKTRLRKKRILSQMEQTIMTLEEEVNRLHKVKNEDMESMTPPQMTVELSSTPTQAHNANHGYFQVSRQNPNYATPAYDFLREC